MIWNLNHRIRNVGVVLFRDAWQFWVSVLVLVGLLLLPRVWTNCEEAALRHSSILLQLAGLLTVARGIYDTRRLFGRPPITVALKAWLAKLRDAILLPPISGTGRVNAHLDARGGGIRLGDTATALVAGATTERRLEILEGVVHALEKRLAQFMLDSTKTAKDLQAGLEAEAGRRERSEAEVRVLIEEQAAGGLHLEIMGLVWLLVGTVLVW